MKTVMHLLAIIFIGGFLSSCVTIVEGPGPDGRPGRAYFGVDYDYEPPYSYWDDNPSIPTDPFLGEYYRSYPGYFEFEYFYNRYDYWYGSYEIWINPGEQGRPGGIPGRDGPDTYLMLILNPEGPYEWRKSNSEGDFTVEELENGQLQLTYEDAGGGIKVLMQRTSVKERPTQREPKFKRN